MTETAKELSVSIITPCYNGARYLQECLESAASQTLPPKEVIVVDDGSTDDSAAIASDFGPPVHVIRQHNQGESVARNRGIDAATGTHMLFLDADDLLHPEALERMVSALEGVERGVALMGHAVFIDGDLTPVQEHTCSKNDFLSAVISKNPGALHSYLTPSTVVREAKGFCEDLTYFEDWDFWCQVALTRAPLVPLDFIGALYRRHPHAQTPTATKVDRKLGHLRVIERLLEGLLKQDDLVQRYGESAYWSAWSAIRSARGLGIPWAELSPLLKHMRSLLSSGPSSLRRSRIGRASRFLGIPITLMLQPGKDVPPEDGPMLRKLQSMREAEAAAS